MIFTTRQILCRWSH